MDIKTLVLASMWALSATGVAWYCGNIAQQITYVTLADGRRKERRMPLLFRLILPLAPNVSPLFRRAIFARPREKSLRDLTAAGFEDLITADEFLSLRILLPVLLGPLWILFVEGAKSVAPDTILGKLHLILCAIGVLWLFVYPGAWLKRVMVRRHRNIQRALPFVLDLLTLSVEAGMDFMTALQRNVDRRKIDALGEELIRVIREIQLGKTRREALRDMARRVRLFDLTSVVNALVQADELGVSIGSILRIQSDQMRQRRFERAEKLANEAPVKMLFPLLVFIFPAVFLILLGPVMVRLLEQGF